MKLCFVASSGGHSEEIACLHTIGEKYDSFIVTEENSCEDLHFGENKYYINQINRHEKNFFIHFMLTFFKTIKILYNERPDVIITTGALIAYPFCLLGKICRLKIIYIESFARIDTPSLTGKLVYPFADLFIVQWKEMQRFYPRSIYTGGIF